MKIRRAIKPDYQLGERPVIALAPLLSIGGSKPGREIQHGLAKGLYRQGMMAMHDRGVRARLLMFGCAFALLAIRAVASLWVKPPAVSMGRK